MSYPFPPNTRALSSFFPLSSVVAKFLFLFQSLTLLSLKCSPLSKSIRSWYGPHEAAYLGSGGGDDDDGGGGGGGGKEDLEATPSYQPRKRQHR